MGAAAGRVVTGAVTRASREVRLNGRGVPKGEYLGLLEGEPVVGGPELEAVARTVVERLLTEPRDVLTLLTGDGGDGLGALAAELEAAYPELEVDLHEGGQPHYLLLASAE
jgi:dihydroxyacetone kinase-like predicted kinase